MKKVAIILLALIMLTGCVSIEKSSYQEIIKEATKSKEKIYNTYRSGYKFYLPKGLYVEDSSEYNEILKGQNAYYYLYIDIISYLNKKEVSYEENKSSHYSKAIKEDNTFGYIEINRQNEKYLIEIIYNYAKIEVMVEEDDLKVAVANSIVILSSIYYNDSLLKQLSEDNLLSYSEETVDIFETRGKETSNFLKYVEEEYSDEEYEIPDYDLIN